MRPASSTTIVVTGAGVAEVLPRLDRLPNVRAASLKGDGAPSVADFVAASHSSYLVHDADPLEHVASAWVEFFDDRATLGTLEVEVSTALEAFRRGDLVLPDYYLVLDPESLAPTWKHWWLGVLSKLARSRVIPVAADASALRRLLGRLPTGRPWPEPEGWLPGLRTTIPDAVGLGG